MGALSGDSTPPVGTDHALLASASALALRGRVALNASKRHPVHRVSESGSWQYLPVPTQRFRCVDRRSAGHLEDISGAPRRSRGGGLDPRGALGPGGGSSPEAR